MTKAKTSKSETKKDNESAEQEERAVKVDRRKSPLLPNAVLWVGFVLLLIAAVFTVVLPELEDDPDGGEATSEAAEPAPAAE